MMSHSLNFAGKTCDWYYNSAGAWDASWAFQQEIRKLPRGMKIDAKLSLTNEE